MQTFIEWPSTDPLFDKLFDPNANKTFKYNANNIYPSAAVFIPIYVIRVQKQAERQDDKEALRRKVYRQ